LTLPRSAKSAIAFAFLCVSVVKRFFQPMLFRQSFLKGSELSGGTVPCSSEFGFFAFSAFSAAKPVFTSSRDH
jgi:hypothetical protein